MNELNLFIPIKKVDVAQRLVYGTLAAEMPDHSGEILDYETAKPAFKAWSDEISKSTDGKSLGNVRAMHTSIAAGKLTDISFDDATKSIMGCAKIIDDNEWNKVLEGVYTGFSMGGKYVKRWTCPSNGALKRYTPSVAEVSIVDNPCIPCATFEVIKADGASEMRKFQVVAEAETDIEQVWRSKKDGTCFAKKAEAQGHNVDLAIKAVPDAIANAMDVLQKAQAAIAAKESPEADAVAKATGTEPVAEPAAEPVVTTPTDEHKAAAFAAAVHKAVLAKQLCDIPQVVDVITSLQWLQSNLEWDSMFDDATVSTLPADLKAILASLCAFLTAMVTDATMDITEDAAKAITFDQAEVLRKFTGKPDLLAAIIAPVEPAKEDIEKVRNDHADALSKFQGELEESKARENALTKTVTDMTSGIGDLMKRIEHLEAQPAPAKGIKNATTTVIKGHEGQATGAENAPDEATLARKYAHLPPEQARAKVAEAMAKGQ